MKKTRWQYAKGKTLSIRLLDSVYATLLEDAESKGIPASVYARLLIEKGLRKRWWLVRALKGGKNIEKGLRKRWWLVRALKGGKN